MSKLNLEVVKGNWLSGRVSSLVENGADRAEVAALLRQTKISPKGAKHIALEKVKGLFRDTESKRLRSLFAFQEEGGLEGWEALASRSSHVGGLDRMILEEGSCGGCVSIPRMVMSDGKTKWQRGEFQARKVGLQFSEKEIRFAQQVQAVFDRLDLPPRVRESYSRKIKGELRQEGRSQWLRRLQVLAGALPPAELPSTVSLLEERAETSTPSSPFRFIPLGRESECRRPKWDMPELLQARQEVVECKTLQEIAACIKRWFPVLQKKNRETLAAFLRASRYQKLLRRGEIEHFFPHLKRWEIRIMEMPLARLWQAELAVGWLEVTLTWGRQVKVRGLGEEVLYVLQSALKKRRFQK